MPADSAPPDLIIARLRAAGCVFAENEARLLREAATDPVELDHLVAERAAGLPLEHVLGWAEFAGLRIAVTPGVFVPRRRSEFLAEQAAALAGRGAVVLDLCCGAGALAAAVLHACGELELHAADIDEVAVRCARRNLPTARVYRGDLFAPLPDQLRGQVEVLVANTPYVPTEAIATMPAEARDYEPRVALDGGTDGLDVQRRVAAEALDWLAPGGYLLVETGAAQAPVTASVFTAHGLTARVAESKDFGATVVIGTAVRTANSIEPRGRTG